MFVKFNVLTLPNIRIKTDKLDSSSLTVDN